MMHETRLTTPTNFEWALQQRDIPVRTKPRRPYTPYNLFYLLERELLVQDEEKSAELKRQQPPRTTPSESKPEEKVPLPARYDNIYLAPQWYEPNLKEKRKHRKTHGKVSFQELTKIISSNWATADDDTRYFCKTISEIGRKKYKMETNLYKASQKKIQLRKEQAEMLAAKFGTPIPEQTHTPPQHQHQHQTPKPEPKPEPPWQEKVPIFGSVFSTPPRSMHRGGSNSDESKSTPPQHSHSHARYGSTVYPNTAVVSPPHPGYARYAHPTVYPAPRQQLPEVVHRPRRERETPLDLGLPAILRNEIVNVNAYDNKTRAKQKRARAVVVGPTRVEAAEDSFDPFEPTTDDDDQDQWHIVTRDDALRIYELMEPNNSASTADSDSDSEALLSCGDDDNRPCSRQESTNRGGTRDESSCDYHHTCFRGDDGGAPTRIMSEEYVKSSYNTEDDYFRDLIGGNILPLDDDEEFCLDIRC